MKILYAVLASKNIPLICRAIDSYGVKPVHLFINTLNDNFRAEVDACDKFNDHIVIHTESSGTPGYGKQRMVEWFLQSDYTHLVQIDGDDMLYPGATDFILKAYKENNANVIALVNEDMMGQTFFTRWSSLTEDMLYRESPGKLSQTGRKFFYMCTQLLAEKYPQNFFHRIMMYDRKTAEMLNYNTTIIGPDDLRIFCDLKLAHIEGKLNLQLVEKPGTYLFDKRNSRDAGVRLNDEEAARIVWDEFHKGLTEDNINTLKTNHLKVIDYDETMPMHERKNYVYTVDKKYGIVYE